MMLLLLVVAPLKWNFQSTSAIILVRSLAKNNWYGVDIMAEDVADNFEACVWEPAIVKINAITAAAEAACLILSVDETVKNPRSGQGEGKMGGMPPMGRGRGRPMM